MMLMGRKTRRLVFDKFGRTYHLKVATIKDLEAILTLDESLWVATSAPLASMNTDRAFLELVDIDKNGRIMCFEINSAIRWVLGVFKNYTRVMEGASVLDIEHLNGENPAGLSVRNSAKKILSHLGKEDANELSLDEVRAVKKKLEGRAISEKGVVLPQATTDKEIQEFIRDVIKVTGGADHPAGGKGVDVLTLDKFVSEANNWLDWIKKSEEQREVIFPFGDDTDSKYSLFKSIEDKLNEYFALCDALKFTPTFKDVVESEFNKLIQSIDIADRKSIESAMKELPLSLPTPDCTLRFETPELNPYYRDTLFSFRDEFLSPECRELRAEEWGEIRRKFAGYEKWILSRPVTDMECIGLEKVKRYLTGEYVESVKKLIAEQKDTALELESVRLVEKAILYQANLVTLVNNFVSFPYLYDPNKRANFEMGTLVMDGRKFNFAVKVDNRAKHMEIAKQSNMFVMYVKVFPRANFEGFEVAIPVTSGNRGNLSIGKRGVFCSCNKDNTEFDAQVEAIIENPISIAEALCSPFRKLGKFVTGKIESITRSAEQKLDKTTSEVVNAVESAAVSSKAPSAGRPSAGSSLLAGGLLMGGGVAIAAISTAITWIVKTLIELGPYKVVVGLLGVIFAVALPISVMAFIKLRKRDLSAILEGAGWAINSRMRLTLRQGRFFTQHSRLPKNARVRSPYRVIVFIFILFVLVVLKYYQLRYFP